MKGSLTFNRKWIYFMLPAWHLTVLSELPECPRPSCSADDTTHELRAVQRVWQWCRYVDISSYLVTVGRALQLHNAAVMWQVTLQCCTLSHVSDVTTTTAATAATATTAAATAPMFAVASAVLISAAECAAVCWNVRRELACAHSPIDISISI